MKSPLVLFSFLYKRAKHIGHKDSWASKTNHHKKSVLFKEKSKGKSSRDSTTIVRRHSTPDGLNTLCYDQGGFSVEIPGSYAQAERRRSSTASLSSMGSPTTSMHPSASFSNLERLSESRRNSYVY